MIKTEIRVEDCPQEITVFLDSQSKEMTKIGDGRWGDVDFYYPHAIYKDPYVEHVEPGPLPSVHMKMDFGTRASAGEIHVLRNLSTLLESQNMIDVVFSIKNQKIGAHSAIVAAASPILAAMFDSPDVFQQIDQEKNIGTTKLIEIDDMDPEVFRQVLQYIYTGKTLEPEQESMIDKLFLAATKYKIETLKQICEERVIKNLSTSNAIRYLVMSHIHEAPRLLDSTLTYLVTHLKETWNGGEWKNLMRNFPDLFYLVTERMIGNLTNNSL